MHLQVREADVGELLDASLKEGVEPSPVGVTYWRQPWVPIYAEWEVALATTDSRRRLAAWARSIWTRRTNRRWPPAPLLGRSLLNSSGARAFAAGVDELLDEEAVADAAGRGILTDAQADDLAAPGRRRRARRPAGRPASPGSTTTTSASTPTPPSPSRRRRSRRLAERLPELLRAGWLRLDRLRLVDASGARSIWRPPRRPGLADALEARPIPGRSTAGVGAAGSPAAPVHAPARLRLRFVDADDDGAEARVDESTAIQRAQPGRRLAAARPRRRRARVLRRRRGLRSGSCSTAGCGRRSRGRAHRAAGPLGAGPAGDLGGSVHLARPGRRAGAARRRRAGGRAAPPDESPLGALLRAIDTTLWTTDPIGATGTAPVSVLVGRPIAVVRLRLRPRALRRQRRLRPSPADAEARRAVFAAMVERAITVRLGALSRFDDGVLGYYVDDDYSVFHPVHAAVRELARHGGPQDGFLDEVTVARQYGDDLTAEPILAPYVQGEPDLIAAAGSGRRPDGAGAGRPGDQRDLRRRAAQGARAQPVLDRRRAAADRAVVPGRARARRPGRDPDAADLGAARGSRGPSAQHVDPAGHADDVA